MSQINTYLTLGGNCHAAMNFYKDIFERELKPQTTGESSLTKKCVLTLSNKYYIHNLETK